MDKEKLNRLADFLDELPSKKFDYNHWYVKVGGATCLSGAEVKTQLENGCGTQACALGWATTLWPDDWHLIDDGTPEPCLITGEECFDAAAQFFDISRGDAGFLFAPDYIEYTDEIEPTDDPKFVAAKIRTFIENGGLTCSDD